MPDEPGITVSMQDMYTLLLKIDRNLTALTSTVGTQAGTLIDHESRLRQIEATELNERRVEHMEDDVRAIRAELEGMKRKVYALPSLASAVAAGALVLTLIRTF